MASTQPFSSFPLTDVYSSHFTLDFVKHVSIHWEGDDDDGKVSCLILRKSLNI